MFHKENRRGGRRGGEASGKGDYVHCPGNTFPYFHRGGSILDVQAGRASKAAIWGGSVSCYTVFFGRTDTWDIVEDREG